MFYTASQVLDFLATPSDLIALVGAVGLILLVIRRKRSGVGLLVVSTSALLLFGYSPLGAIVLAQLEDRFPMLPPPGTVTGIILLGGTVDTHISQGRGVSSFNDAGERLTATMSLAQLYPQARVIIAGGGGIGKRSSSCDSTIAPNGE